MWSGPHAGCVFLGKSKSGFPNPKTDHESIKSTLRVDSSHEIQSGFGGKDLKKVLLTSGFSKKKWYVTDAVHVCW